MIKNWESPDGFLHSGVCLGSKNEFDVIDCTSCNFSHVIPLPSEKFLSDYYAKHFVKNRPRGFYQKMEKDLSWVEILHNEKYDLFENHLKNDTRSILDIGSGLGFFLKTGNSRGWKTLGVEPSIDSYEYSSRKGLNIHNIYLNNNNYKKLGKFDVVHMHEVIEHLPNPEELIKIAKNLLNPGGLICIGSPNDFNQLQKSFVKINNSEKWWICPPEHINYFNFKSIKKLLKKNNFKIVEQTSTFPLEIFLLMGDNYIGNKEIGRIIHKRRVTFEKNLKNMGYEKLRRKVYNKFSKLGLGREFCIIGKVNE
jgi:2-polyprenyl-3-methyl-5-hydroxy-6-metoxy-1,4-benzoquinol methylase